MRKTMTILFVTALFVSGAAFAQMPGDGPGGHRGPPEEAIAACDGMAAGDSCTVEIPSRVLEGTCEASPFEEDSSELACRPQPPEPPSDDEG